MKLNLKIYSLVIIFFSIGIVYSYGTDYYVKNGGNDDLSGTSEVTAWATITKVK